MSGANSVNCSAAAIAFDRIAASYDRLFTHTKIGRAQRQQVSVPLLKAFPRGSRVLELNCGTGEDARFLAGHGRSIVALDGSAAMIAIAERQSAREMASGMIRYQRIGNENLEQLRVDEPFDGAFSNFSGLNCVAELGPVAKHLATMVRPGGRILLCLWSRICVSEAVWFMLHGQFRKAIRRFSGTSPATVGGVTVTVRYPTIATVRRNFAPWFRLESRRAIGLFVPPSYAEAWANKNTRKIAQFERWDRALGAWPILQDLGDHVLMEFVRCSR